MKTPVTFQSAKPVTDLPVPQQLYLELPDVVDLAAALGIDKVYLQRMTYCGDGLATSDQAIYRSEDAELLALIDRVEVRARELGIRFAGAGEMHPRDNLSTADSSAPRQGCHRPWRPT